MHPAKDRPFPVLESSAHCGQGGEQATHSGGQIGSSDSGLKGAAGRKPLVLIRRLCAGKWTERDRHSPAMDRSRCTVGITDRELKMLNCPSLSVSLAALAGCCVVLSGIEPRETVEKNMVNLTYGLAHLGLFGFGHCCC